jgi:hypothetical protein
MGEVIAVSFVVPLGARPGDTARLYSNGGGGDIDWDTPATGGVFDLFPGGAGNYGFGLAPFGLFRWGLPYSKNTLGFGLLPFGLSPWGLGAVLVRDTVEAEDCGDYKFAFGAFDPAGNWQEGTPGQGQIEVHIAPPAPFGLKKDTYNPDTDILILSVHNPADNRRSPGLPSRMIGYRGDHWPGYDDGLPGRLPPYIPGDGSSPANPGLPTRI